VLPKIPLARRASMQLWQVTRFADQSPSKHLLPRSRLDGTTRSIRGHNQRRRSTAPETGGNLLGGGTLRRTAVLLEHKDLGTSIGTRIEEINTHHSHEGQQWPSTNLTPRVFFAYRDCTSTDLHTFLCKCMPGKVNVNSRMRR
jgi:hypothetical protein